MTFAAETAAKGTNRPTSGGSFLTRALRPRAVPKAPPVARTYDVAEIRDAQSFIHLSLSLHFPHNFQIDWSSSYPELTWEWANLRSCLCN